MDTLASQIHKAIGEFDFGDYSLDEVNDVKGEDWHEDLAKFIASQITTTNNRVSGNVTGRVIQARDIHGGVDFRHD